MLRLTLLRLPRAHPAQLHTRARHALIYASAQASCTRRYVSSSPDPLQDPLKQAKAKPAESAPSSSHAEDAQSSQADKQDETSTIYIAPSPAADNVEYDNTKDPEPEKADTTRSSSGPQAVAGIDMEELKGKLRIWSENAAISIRERTDRYTASAITTFAQLGRELNKVTGYGEIESLKKQVAEQEARIKTARARAREAKQELERAVYQRVKSQREVNDLLSRKSSWTDDDVVRFTALVRKDHLYEQAEGKAKAEAIHTEDEVDREFTELMRVILNRYHEEQIWSDKIRSASTYGSLTVIGLNMLIFILAIIIVEPWKRRKLAQTFERKVEEMSAETIAAFNDKSESLAAQMQHQQQTLSQLVEVVSYSVQPAIAVPPASAPVHTPEELPPPIESLAIEEESTSSKILRRTLSRLSPPDPEITVVVAATATVAGIIGWAIGRWIGS